MSIVPITSADLQQVEVAWFAPLCNEDTAHLGVLEPQYKSNWHNTSQICLKADELGFGNILCPSSYQVGQDTLTFASAVSSLTQNINLLAAIRCGEQHPAMLARSIATLDHILEGRLTLNIISSNMPGEDTSSQVRYARSKEVVEILRQAWTRETINYSGDYYQLQNLSTEPVQPYQQAGGPLLYFGGYSPPALDLCGEHCDVYLMWPETEEHLAQRMRDAHAQAARYGRTLDFGLRVHMIVRDTEQEAREYAQELVSQLEDEQGDKLRSRALDASSLGVAYQAQQRAQADRDGYSEPFLWTGIGRARSGCGAALVGSVEQILEKLESYKKMGIRAFIFSGYPHLQECQTVGEKLVSQMHTCSLPEVYGRIPNTPPSTPLAQGTRR